MGEFGDEWLAEHFGEEKSEQPGERRTQGEIGSPEFFQGRNASQQNPDLRVAPEMRARAAADAEITRARDQTRSNTLAAAEGVGAMVGGPLGAGAKPVAGALGRMGTPVAKRLLKRMFGAGAGSTAGNQAFGGADGQQAVEAFARGAVGELIGDKAEKLVVRPLGEGVVNAAKNIPGVRKLVEPFKSKAVPDVDDTLSIVQGGGLDNGAFELAQMGREFKQATPTAGQVSDSSTVDMIESILEGSLGGDKVIGNTRRRAEGVATTGLRDLVSQFKNGGEEFTGIAMKQALTGAKELHQKSVGAASKKIQRKYGNIPISTRGKNALGKSLAENLKGLKRSNKQAFSIIEDALEAGTEEGATSLDRLMNGTATQTPSNTMPFSEAAALRRDLLAIGRLSTDVLPDNTTRIVKGMAKVVDTEIKQGLKKGAGLEAVGEWRGFNDVVKSGHEKFNNEVMRQLIGATEPETTAKMMIGAPASRVRNVFGAIDDATKKGLADPRLKDQVRGLTLNDALNDATDPLTKDVSGKGFNASLKSIGDESGLEMFGRETWGNLKKYGAAIERTQKDASLDKNLGVAMKLVQAGAVFELGTGLFGSAVGVETQDLRGSAAVLLSPVGLAKVFSSPAAVRWLTVGATTPAGSKTASRAFGQLVAHLDDIMLQDEAIVLGDVPSATGVEKALTPSQALQQGKKPN